MPDLLTVDEPIKDNLYAFKEAFDTLASTVAGPGDGLIEAGKLAKVLQVPVHQLVRQNRQRTAIRIFLVLID